MQEAARPDLRAAGEASPDTPRFHIGSSQWKLSLPVPATRLVGRSADLDEISKLLAEQTRTGVTLTRRESWVVLSLYAVFLAWAVAESLGLVDRVGGG